MPATASFTGVIKVIFYFLLFYYLFKFVMRLILPLLLKKAVEKAEENLRRQTGNYNSQHGNVDTSQSANPPKERKQVGEYVDYEEIE